MDRDIGDTVEYSNVGYGLLGHALALREGTDFETLIVEGILEPLPMPDTAVELTPALRERLATGHDAQLQPAPNWGLPVLAGAGALRSTVNDLLTFLEANLGLRESPLHQAMELARMPQRSDPALGMDIGLGWIIAKEGDREFVWHNGATGGYASFIGFDAEAGEGIVILSNSGLSVTIWPIACSLATSTGKAADAGLHGNPQWCDVTLSGVGTVYVGPEPSSCRR